MSVEVLHSRCRHRKINHSKADYKGFGPKGGFIRLSGQEMVARGSHSRSSIEYLLVERIHRLALVGLFVRVVLMGKGFRAGGGVAEAIFVFAT